MPEHIAFTSVNTWVARALFRSTFWEAFSNWGTGTLIVPQEFHPLQEIADLADAPPQQCQAHPPTTRWSAQWWLTMRLINGYRLTSQTRQLLQDWQIERNRGKERWLRIVQRIAALSLHRLRLARGAELAYWRWLAWQPMISQLRASLEDMGAEGIAICGSERSADHPYVLAAQQLGLPIAVIIRSWDNLSSKTTAIPRADGYIVWSAEMQRELQLLAPWIGDEQVHIVGASQFDRHSMTWVPERRAFFATVGLDADAGGPLLLYSCGGTHLGEADQYAVKSLIQLLKRGVFPAGTQLLVRLHPFLSRQTYNAILYDELMDQSRVALWPPQDAQTALSDYDVLLGSLAYQSVNINIASTMSLDSMLFDKPVVNVAFNGGAPLNYVRDIRDFYRFDHYRTLVERGGLVIAETSDDLHDYILEALERPATRQQQRADTVRFHIGEPDGQAGRRTADALQIILNGRQS